MPAPRYDHLPGVHPAPNIQSGPDLYEIENLALDPERRIEAAMQEVLPLNPRTPPPHSTVHRSLFTVHFPLFLRVSPLSVSPRLPPSSLSLLPPPP